MNRTEDLLIILGSYSAGYALMRRRFRGDFGPAKFRNIQKNFDARSNTLRIALSRLKKRGLVENDGMVWRITGRGREYIRRRIAMIKKSGITAPPHGVAKFGARSAPKNMIISFDIPEAERAKRNWLRVELKILGFSKLQQSVWFGPAPLPRRFVESLGRAGLLTYLKFFKASEYDVV